MQRSRWIVALLSALFLLLAACEADSDTEGEAAAPEPETEADPEPEEPEDAEGEAEADEADPAEDDTEFEHDYEDGETITLVIGAPPGGGSDTQARALAPYIEEALLEVTGADMNVIVDNREGGQNRLALEYMYSSAEPDGREFFYLVAAAIAVQLQLVDGADFDVRDYVMLGQKGVGIRGIATRTDLDLPENTLEGLAAYSEDNPILVASSYVADLEALQHMLEEEGVTLNATRVPEQLAPGATAMLRGELEAQYSTANSMNAFIEDNPDDLQMLAIMHCDRDPAVPDYETIVEQGLPGAEEICELLGSDARIFLGPPDLPDTHTQVLREAIWIAVNNPEFEELAEQGGFATAPVEPDEAEQNLDGLFNTWEELLPQLDLED